MHLLSVTLNLIRRFRKRQVPRGGVYGGLVILAHPRLMVRECTLIFEPYRALNTKSSNITLVNTSKLLQVTTLKRKSTLTTYFLVKTQNSVQQANSLTR